MRHLVSTAKLFNVKGVPMIGNPSNGAIIGLTPSGKKFIDQVSRNGVDDTDLYEGESRAIVMALERFGLLDGEPRQQLASAYVHLTDHCNLHCVGCYSLVDNRNAHKDLSGDEYALVLDKLAAAGVKQVVFSGGEPTMHREIVRIVRHAKDLGLRTVLITNGTIAPKRVLPVAELVDVLSVSIDGYDNQSVYLRDPGIMDRILSFVRQMKSVTTVHLIVTLHRQNVSVMDRYIDLAQREGVTFNFSILTVRPDDSATQGFVLHDQDLAQIAQFLSDSDDVYVEETVLARTSTDAFGLKCANSCGVARSLVSVSADGVVFPCHMLQDQRLALGDILGEDMNTILARGQSIAQITVDDIEGCCDCEFKYLCGGGCRARSYLYYGDLTHRDPFCPMSRRFLDTQTSQLRDMLVGSQKEA